MELHLFQKAWQLIDINPYGMKVDAFMRLNNLTFTVIYDGDASHAPRGELPYLTDNDMKIGDSSNIIEYLTNKYNLTLDDDLSPAQIALSICVQRMLEEHMYPIILYSRMVDPIGFSKFKHQLLAMNPDMDEMKLDNISKNINKNLIQKGIGKFEEKEIYKRGLINLNSIQNLLDDRSFFFNINQNFHSIDATLYAFLENIRNVPIETPINAFVTNSVVLNNYCDSFKKIVYKKS